MAALSARAALPIRPLWAALAVGLGLAAAVLPPQFLLAAILGAALVALAAWEPAAGLGLAMILGPSRAYLAIAFPGLLPDLGQVFFGLALAGWLARGLWTRSLTVPRSWLWLPLGLYIGAGMLSLLGAASLEEGAKETIKWLQVAAVVTIFLAEARRGRIWWIVAAVLAAGLAQALIGLSQYGFQVNGPEHFQIAGGRFRAYGSFEQPNPYGGFLGLVWPLAAGVLTVLVARAWARPGWQAWAAAGGMGIVVGLLVSGLFASFSRGAWLGAAAAAGALAMAWPRRWLAGIGLAAAAGALLWGATLAGLLPASISARLSDVTDLAGIADVRGATVTSANFALVERQAHWQAAYGMVRDHRWLGVGLGNFAVAYPRYALLNWPMGLGHAHMIYLNVAAETGLVGFVTYLGLWAIIVIMTVRAVRKRAGMERGLALGLLGAWAHLSVHQLVDNLYVNNIHLTIAVLLGLLLWLTRTTRGDKGPGSIRSDGVVQNS